MRIYTRTGDKGETSLYGGKRVPKFTPRVDLYGAIDELNSLLGMVLSKLKDERAEVFVNEIQKDLFLIGSSLAGARVSLSPLKERVEEMERVIDSLDESLPTLAHFILPEGTESATLTYFARAVARRVERKIVAFAATNPLDQSILVYFNRLSDFLFVLARFLNFKAGEKETIWKGKSG